MGDTGDGAAAGAGAGAAAGATVGTAILPGVGTLVGAGVGAVVGGVTGGIQGRAQGRQKANAKKLVMLQAILAQQEAESRRVQHGKALDSIGVLPVAGEGYRDSKVALGQHAKFGESLDAQASSIREAGLTGLNDSAQTANVERKAAVASRGLFGSSLDTSSRQDLLGQYAGQRGSAIANAEGFRTAGNAQIESKRRQLTAIADRGQDISGQQNTLGEITDYQNVRAGIPAATFGTMLSTAIDAGGNIAKKSASTPKGTTGEASYTKTTDVNGGRGRRMSSTNVGGAP